MGARLSWQLTWRIGLGLAVTLEFLGPLAIALLTSRNRGSAICAVIAGVGVVAITRPEASTDYPPSKRE